MLCSTRATCCSVSEAHQVRSFSLHSRRRSQTRAQLGTAQIYPNAAAAASINGALGAASTAPTWDVQHEPAAAAKDRPSPTALPLHETSDTDRRAIQGGPLPDAAGHHCSIDDERPLNAAAPQAALLPHQHQHAPDPPVEYDMDFAQRVRLLSFEAPWCAPKSLFHLLAPW